MTWIQIAKILARGIQELLTANNWPIVVFVVIFMFRKNLKDLFDRLESARVGSNWFGFQQPKLKDIKADASRVEPLVPDGILIRADGFPEVYITDESKKRHICHQSYLAPQDWLFMYVWSKENVDQIETGAEIHSYDEVKSIQKKYKALPYQN
jgi:hypothetical protein